MSEKDVFSSASQLNARTSGTYHQIASSVDKCVFCDLKPKYILKEQDNLVLTMNIFPYIDGQLMVIPRRHIEHFSEVTPEEAATCFLLSQTAVALLRAEPDLDVQGVWMILRDGDNAGKTVKHLHWNIMPYKEGINQWNYQNLTIKPEALAVKLRERLNRYD